MNTGNVPGWVIVLVAIALILFILIMLGHPIKIG